MWRVPSPIANGWYRDLLLLKPQQHLPRTPEFLEFPEHQVNAILYPHIGIQFNIIHAPAQAYRQAKAQFTSLCLLSNCF